VTFSSDKAELRQAMRGLRRKLAAGAPDAAVRLARHVPAGLLPKGGIYSLYHPVGSEIDPREIRLAGGAAALPVVVDREGPLAFRLHRSGDRLAPDAMGILAPPPEAPQVEPDVIFTPVLAFDRRGGRLGQGAGCYDRTIAALRALKPVVVIGVAYAGQELADVPMAPHDQRLDGILTETGYVQVR